MNGVCKFRDLVLALAAMYGVNLDVPGAYLRLEQERCGSLVIESIGGSRISVTNYIRVGDSYMADPEIVVHVVSAPDSQDGLHPQWYPIEMNQFFGGWQLCADLDLNGDLVIYDVEQQVEMAHTIETIVAVSAGCKST